MKIDCNENINTYIPAVRSPKTLQHCLGKGYLPHTEGQQCLQHFNLVGVTQKLAGAEARGDGEAVSSGNTSSICSKRQALLYQSWDSPAQRWRC